jgi:hypothetical protein
MFPDDRQPGCFICLDSDLRMLKKFSWSGGGTGEVEGEGEEDGEGDDADEPEPSYPAIKKIKSPIVWGKNAVAVDVSACGRCAECVKAGQLFQELEDALLVLGTASGPGGVTLDKDVDVDREQKKLDKIKDSFSRYRSHVVRCVVQQEAYQSMMDRVRRHRDFVFVVIDWK